MSENDWNNIEKIVLVLLAVIMTMVVAMLMSSCKQVEYVMVPEVHEVHHNHTDSVFQRDSVVKESLTTVMQLDSAAMAKYGIQLKNAERAWLVRTAELERQIQQLKEMRNDSIHEVDTVYQPYPVEVVKEVEKPLSWWQRTKMKSGVVFMMLLGGGLLFLLYKLTKRLGLINF